MKITHHPSAESLMSCSGGSMPENFAAIMSSHLTMCPACREELALMDAIGQAMFERVPPAALKSDAPVMELRAREADVDASPTAADASGHGEVPAPLVAAIGKDLDGVPWRRVSPGVWQHVVKSRSRSRGDLRLIKVAPGVALPEHAHRGSELTLVLTGAFNDETGRYGAGDVADVSDNASHSPTADPLEGCICLVATEDRLRFKGLLARILQPFTGF